MLAVFGLLAAGCGDDESGDAESAARMPSRKREQTRPPLRAWLKRLLLRLRRLLPTRLLLRLTLAAAADGCC